MNTKLTVVAKKLNTGFLVLLIFGAILFNYSCNDDANMLGSNLISDNDKIGYLYDTTQFNFTSFLETQKHYRSKNLTSYYVGLINSSYHGSFEGTLVTQFKPNQVANVFKTAIVDSAVLFLNVDSIYGVTNNNFVINVYELDSAISEDPIYYVSTDFSNMYSESNKINSSYRLQGDSIVAFKLSPEFTALLVNNTYAANDTVDSLFSESFKGIAIVPQNPAVMGGQLFKINTVSGNSRIAVFYNDSLSASYYLSNGNRFGTYKYNTAGSQLNNFLENPEAESDSLIYLQGLNGVHSKIILNNYIDWINVSKYSIIKAELIFPIYETGESQNYFYPDNLYLAQAETDSTFVTTIDADNSKFFDGTLDLTKKQYRFDISRYMQNLLNGKETDSCMYIRINNYNSEPNRVVLKSGDNIKLKITYTKH